MTRPRFDAAGAAQRLAACRRIAVLGSGGAGKSTLSRELAALLDLPLHHLDQLFWLPGWRARADAEWERIQNEIVLAEHWVIDGNYSRTLDIRLARADGVLFLDLPREICLWRAFWRGVRLRGKVRPDLAAGCPEHFDLEFLQWIWRFPLRSRERVLRRRAVAPYGQAWIVVRRPRDVRRLLAALRAARGAGTADGRGMPPAQGS